MDFFVAIIANHDQIAEPFAADALVGMVMNLKVPVAAAELAELDLF